MSRWIVDYELCGRKDFTCVDANDFCEACQNACSKILESIGYKWSKDLVLLNAEERA